jgi:hypothetical protein
MTVTYDSIVILFESLMEKSFLAFCCAAVFPFDVIDMSVSEFIFVGAGRSCLSTTAIFFGLGSDIAARSVFVLSAQGHWHSLLPLGPHPVALKIFVSLFGSRSAAHASGLGSSVDFPAPDLSARPVFGPKQVARSYRAPKFLGPPSSIAHILPLCSGRRPDSKSGSVIYLGRGGWAIITAVPAGHIVWSSTASCC